MISLFRLCLIRDIGLLLWSCFSSCGMVIFGLLNMLV